MTVLWILTVRLESLQLGSWQGSRANFVGIFISVNWSSITSAKRSLQIKRINLNFYKCDNFPMLIELFSRESDCTITNVCPFVRSFVRSFVRPFVCKTPTTARIQSFDLTTILTTMLTIFLVTLTIILTPILHQHHYPINNRSTGTTILTLFHLPPSPSSPHMYPFNKSTGTTILLLYHHHIFFIFSLSIGQQAQPSLHYPPYFNHSSTSLPL